MKRNRDVPAEPIEATVREDGKVQVWNPDTGQVEWVTVPEAAAGMAAYINREYPAGSLEHAAMMQRLVAFLTANGYTPGGQRIGETDG